MKIKSFVGLILAGLVAIFGGGCASSKMDVQDKVVVHKMLGTNIVADTFSHTDKSKIAPGAAGRTYERGGGSFFRIRAEVGGGGGYDDGGYGGGYGYPVVTVPIESQGAFQHQTMQRYGLGGGGSGSYNPTPMGGSYNPTSMGSYSPTPMR